MWLSSNLWPREIERRERAEVNRWLDSDIWGRESEWRERVRRGRKSESVHF